MLNKRLFDRRYIKAAFVRLCAMLRDPRFAYQHIGGKFGLTRQRIARIATELGIDGWQRQRERMLRRGPHIVIKQVEYPVGIRSVIDKIKQSGIRVSRPTLTRAYSRAVPLNLSARRTWMAQR